MYSLMTISNTAVWYIGKLPGYVLYVLCPTITTLETGFSNLVFIKITRNTSKSTDSWTPSPEVLIQLVWGERTWVGRVSKKCIFLSSRDSDWVDSWINLRNLMGSLPSFPYQILLSSHGDNICLISQTTQKNKPSLKIFRRGKRHW